MGVIFYRKTGITDDGYLDGTFTELSDGQSTSNYISGGERKRLCWWNIKASDPPYYGAAEIVGLRLFLYSSEVKNYSRPTLLDSGDGTGANSGAIRLYRAKQAIEFKEGDTVPSNPDILQYSSVMFDTPMMFESFKGSNMYTEPDVSVSVEGNVKTLKIGAYITVADAHSNQKGHKLGKTLSKSQLWTRYSERSPKTFGVPRIETNMDTLGPGVQLPGVGGQSFTMSGDEDGFIQDIFKTFDSYDQRTETPPTGIDLDTAKIPVMVCPKWKNVTATTIDRASHSYNQGKSYVDKKINDAADWLGLGRPLDEGALGAPEVKTKYIPRHGREFWSDDIYFYEKDISIKHNNTDIVESFTVDVPILKAPPENTFVDTRNSIWQNIRKTPNKQFNVQDSNVDAERIDIAQSNMVFTAQSSTDACLFENIHAYFANDGTQDGDIRGTSPDGSSATAVKFLQEVRGQVYVPAPLNMWPERMENAPHPYIDVPVKLKLPPAFVKNSETAIKTRMRRAAWIGFSRFPIGAEYDMGVWWDANSNEAKRGAYGVCLFREAINNNDEMYTIVSWHDLTSDSGDPYFNNDGKGTNVLGYIPRNIIEEEYVLFRFALTWDGIKLLACHRNDDGDWQSCIYYTKGEADNGTNVGSTGGDIAVKLGDDVGGGGKPYISLTGHRKSINNTVGHYDDNREHSFARKYHIKSSLAGTEGSTTSQYNVWRTGNSPGGDYDAHANCGINGIDAASLAYMWNPYLTISLLNTRFNGDAMSDNEAYHANFGNSKDSISRLYIDSIGSYRFNYSHSNASVNSGNTSRGSLIIPETESYYFTKVDSNMNDNGDTTNLFTDDNAGGVSLAREQQQYAYVSLGFKTKAEAEASNKFFLMNNYITANLYDSELATRADMIDFMYSGESEPFGEFYPRSFGTTSTTTYKSVAIKATTASGFFTGGATNSGRNSNNIYVGTSIKQYSFFGSSRLDSETKDVNRGTASTGINHSYYWPSHQGLIADTDYDTTGNNRTEAFSQSGIFSVNWEDDSSTALGHKVYVKSSPVDLSNVNDSTDFPSMYYDISHSSSSAWKVTPSQDTTAWHCGFGLRQAQKNGSVMSDYVMPNLNWMIKWSDDTSTTAIRNRVDTIAAVDANATIYTNRHTTDPATGDHGKLFPGHFVRRENPFVQARIISATKIGGKGYPFDGTDPLTYEIAIDTEEPLKNAEDEIYIIYHASREWVPSIEHSDGTSTGISKDHTGESSDIKRQNIYCYTLVKVERTSSGSYRVRQCNSSGTLGSLSGDGTTNPANIHNGEDVSGSMIGSPNRIFFDVEEMLNTSDNSQTIGTSSATIPRGKFLNSHLCISPWRYWLYLRLPLTENERSFSSVVGVTSTLDADFSELAGSDGCAIRSTFNESDFTDNSSLGNYWTWDVRDTQSSKIDLSTDYGFGAFSSDSGEGGHCGESGIVADQYNQINIDGLATARGSLNPSDDLTIIGIPSDGLDNSLFAFDSAEATNKPYVLTAYLDKKPARPANFTVEPDEETPFFPKFSWETNDDDLWYALLFVDSKPIHNQYHKCLLHIPMNESVASTATTSYYRPNQDSTNTTPTLYKGIDTSGLETRAGFVTVSGVTSDIEGLAGYTSKFDGTNDYMELADGTYTQPTTDFSISFHVTPDSLPSNNKTILHKLNEYQIELNTNGQITVKMFPDTETTPTTSDIPVELKSSTSINCDGTSPTHVAVTLDTTLKYGNVKLYIDGKIEDQSGLKKTEGSKNNWILDRNLENHTGKLYIGRDSAATSTAYYSGKLEELTLYNHILIPLTPRDQTHTFIKPVSELTESTESVSKSYTGKLFLKDYHNIRGASKMEISTSSPVSFRKAAFRLRTGDD